MSIGMSKGHPPPPISLAIWVCIGMSIGMSIGHPPPPIGLAIGICIGMSIGMTIQRSKKCECFKEFDHRIAKVLCCLRLRFRFDDRRSTFERRRSESL